MKKTLLLFAILFVALTTKADEGMWLLKELNKESAQRMKELGFTFPINKLYDENNPSLKDAVVIFGRGCTGVAVSDKGLIFTNHHCGYGAIQKLSAVEHDYLKDGFAATDFTHELPADGLTIMFLRSTEDVTDKILSQVPADYSEIQRTLKIDSVSKEMLVEYENNPFVSARMVPFYSGNKYYVVTYDVYRDVRLVVTPPESIGKFGGDTDNWMWPRHTGDFSVFRVYANKENKPAEYSKDNVPYKPKYVVPVSLNGVKPNDYAMTIGYPGTTQRYLSSWGISQMMESENKPRIEVRGIKQGIWREAMNNDEAIRIQYASKYARSSNYWKNAMGMNEALTRLKVLDKKRALESTLDQWIQKKSSRRATSGTTLQTLKEAYSASNDNARYTTYFLETFRNGIEITRFANTILRFDINSSDEEKREFINERLINAYKDYNPALDKKVLPALMKLYASRVPKQNLPDIYGVILDKFQGDYEKYADWLFANSKFTTLKDLRMILKENNSELLMKDPAMELAVSVKDMGYELSEKMMPQYEKIMRGERELMAALIKMQSNKTFYPDANFTQRLSYGSIKGYKPRDGAWYDYYTTTNGILEKEKPGDHEFDVQPYILKSIEEQNFEKYASKDGTVHVAFLSDNDITGGNSGSPVFNGKAELIGLAFDGNWESLSGDILFEPEMQRTISVDIRYVLYVIDKIMKAPHIVNELELAKK